MHLKTLCNSVGVLCTLTGLEQTGVEGRQCFLCPLQSACSILPSPAFAGRSEWAKAVQALCLGGMGNLQAASH